MTGHGLLTLPIAIPLVGVALCTILAGRRLAQRIVSLTASIALLVSALALLAAVFDGTVLATQFGGWRAPFGITFVADLFSAAMVVITGIMAVAVGVYGLVDRAKRRERTLYHPLYQGLLLGVVGAFLTGDIFNLYVWFEIMLISSFGLLVIGGSREQLDGAVKYVALNLVATTLFLLSVAFLYGATGTLNLAQLAQVVPSVENQGLITAIAVMLLLAFGAKAAVFPLFFWLPAAYHTASAPVVAIFAAMLTKVGVYAMIRVVTLVFPETALIAQIVGGIAILTMVTGVLGAAAHYDVRRILSFHIISQIGYMLFGLAIATPLAVAGSILYVMHHIVVKANLFLLAGVINRAAGSFDLKKIGGLARSAPLVAALFVIPAFSLAGLPPLSGFWSKFVVLKAGFDAGHVALATTGLAVGLLTLYSMLKIWNEAFWKSEPERSRNAIERWRRFPVVRRTMLLPIAALAAITLSIGLVAEPFMQFSTRAAAQLLAPATYIDAVLPQAAVAVRATTEIGR
ncbi:MAG: Na+/H+ antiporter subunit D [Gemmatimonadales bacterium]